MYKNRKILLVAPALNEKGKIEQVADKVPYDIVDKFLVVDDGSTDGTPDIARAHGADVLVHDRCMGVGTAIRDGYRLAADEGFDIVVIIAGNAKDDPREISRLLDPICDDDCRFRHGLALPARRRLRRRHAVVPGLRDALRSPVAGASVLRSAGDRVV